MNLTGSRNLLAGGAALLAAVAIVTSTVRLADRGQGNGREYDVLFDTSVEGVARGSKVMMRGVEIGTVDEVSIWTRDPSLVRVRVRVDAGVPILHGTTAAITHAGFTGVGKVALDGARAGAPPLGCAKGRYPDSCPLGVPVIPSRPSGLEAVLTSAPQLATRGAALGERVAAVTGGRNREALSGIEASRRRLAGSLGAVRGTIAGFRADARTAGQKVEHARAALLAVRDILRGPLAQEARQTAEDLGRLRRSAQNAARGIAGAADDLRPGLETVSRRIMPQARALGEELRPIGRAARNVSNRMRQGGPSGLLAGPAAPTYRGSNPTPTAVGEPPAERRPADVQPGS